VSGGCLLHPQPEDAPCRPRITGLLVITNDSGEKKLAYFETTTETNTKQLENRMETHEVYLYVFYIWPIRYSANVKTIFDSSHGPTLAVACKIRCRSCRSDCGTGGWYPWSFTYPHRLGFPLVPFFHTTSRCPGFISNVPPFKRSSVTLISNDNRSVTDDFSAIGTSMTMLTRLVANSQNTISQIISVSVGNMTFFHLCW
jgi:hypothetical protein